MYLGISEINKINRTVEDENNIFPYNKMTPNI